MPIYYEKVASDWNFNLPFSVRLGVELNLFVEQLFIESLVSASLILSNGNIKFVLNRKKSYRYVIIQHIVYWMVIMMKKYK